MNPYQKKVDEMIAQELERKAKKEKEKKEEAQKILKQQSSQSRIDIVVKSSQKK